MPAVWWPANRVVNHFVILQNIYHLYTGWSLRTRGPSPEIASFGVKLLHHEGPATIFVRRDEDEDHPRHGRGDGAAVQGVVAPGQAGPRPTTPHHAVLLSPSCCLCLAASVLLLCPAVTVLPLTSCRNCPAITVLPSLSCRHCPAVTDTERRIWDPFGSCFGSLSHCTLRRSVNRNSPPGLMPNESSLSFGQARQDYSLTPRLPLSMTPQFTLFCWD